MEPPCNITHTIHQPLPPFNSVSWPSSGRTHAFQTCQPPNEAAMKASSRWNPPPSRRSSAIPSKLILLTELPLSRQLVQYGSFASGGDQFIEAPSAETGSTGCSRIMVRQRGPQH